MLHEKDYERVKEVSKNETSRVIDRTCDWTALVTQGVDGKGRKRAWGRLLLRTLPG